jgi:carboxymethylenebutenolidase
MERKKASDFDPELLGLFHRYVHGGLSRREFLDGAAKFAVGGLTVAALWDMLKPNYAPGAASPQRRQPNQGGVHNVPVSQG